MTAADTLAVFRRPLPEALARLRAAMAAAGCYAESPAELDGEAERAYAAERADCDGEG